MEQPQKTLTQAHSSCVANHCPKCQKVEFVTVEQTIVGEKIVTSCHCRACGYSWHPVVD